jgi:hypothetical protein
MPPEKGVGLDEEALLTSRREHSAQPGEHGPVGPTKSGPRHLAPQDSKLVAQYDDLDGQVLLPPPRQPDQLEDTNEGQVQEGERHALIFALEERSSKVQVSDPDGILGTHTAIESTDQVDVLTNGTWSVLKPPTLLADEFLITRNRGVERDGRSNELRKDHRQVVPITHRFAISRP